MKKMFKKKEVSLKVEPKIEIPVEEVACIETTDMSEVRQFVAKGYRVVEKRSPQGERLAFLYVLKLFKEESNG